MASLKNETLQVFEQFPGRIIVSLILLYQTVLSSMKFLAGDYRYVVTVELLIYLSYSGSHCSMFVW